ncbi:sodium:alanine symporter family protein [uncultured Peptoniphilus sp.]|uniref:alanine/glycine:cation symporter family protein n=1 Tax=uncultured Peptoniphilus sp. TaxID=254354 RepID=UPI00280476A4|nr:sodium:alanine symporter family protein [uncultured Peptoniphilus sp.]
MEDKLLAIVKSINGVLWGVPMMVILVGCGIFYTLALRGIQVRDFGLAFKKAFSGFSLKGKKAGADGMSSFQSLATAIAGQVGTGNLTGSATAIISGGPGAIFWMWISAFFGMATIFAEAVLGQKYKVVKDGQVTGGPAYYLRNGIHSKVLAALFAIFITIALGLVGNLVQANSIGQAFSSVIDVPTWVVGLVIVVISGFIFIGGVGRIASVTEKIVPVMAFFYILGGIIILIKNGGATADAFRQIFVGAFKPEAVLGGAAGVTVRQAVRYGVARGLFSNEAGMGSTPHAHAIAKVNHPCDQGLVAIVGVFIDTFVVLTINALVIIATGANQIDGLKGIKVTQKAFELGIGHVGVAFIAVALFFFAFSTIIGWYFYGEANVRYLFGQKGIGAYRILALVFIYLGTMFEVDLVWELADMFNAMMVIPNVIGVIGLYKVVQSTLNEYQSLKLDVNPNA